MFPKELPRQELPCMGQIQHDADPLPPPTAQNFVTREVTLEATLHSPLLHST